MGDGSARRYATAPPSHSKANHSITALTPDAKAGVRLIPDDRIRADGFAELLLKMSHSSSEIGLLKGEHIRRFAKAATALRHFSVSLMFKLDRHLNQRFLAASLLGRSGPFAIDKYTRQWH